MMIADAKRLPNGTFTTISVGNMFLDCLDRSQIDPEGHPTAMMYTKATRDVPKALAPDVQTTRLRVVDPYRDPHIWAIVDDACNSCAHGEFWMKDAIEKWKKLGHSPVLKSDEQTSFSGLGQNTTQGQYWIRFSSG